MTIEPGPRRNIRVNVLRRPGYNCRFRVDSDMHSHFFAYFSHT